MLQSMVSQRLRQDWATEQQQFALTADINQSQHLYPAAASESFSMMLQVRAKSLLLCPIVCNPMDSGLLGSSVHGILQARIVEWVALPSSRGSSQCRDQTHVSFV